MGWGRMLLLGNWGQQLDIEDTQRELQSLRASINAQRAADRIIAGKKTLDQEQSAQIKALQAENEQFQLCVATLARLLYAKGVVSREEFDAIAGLIDGEK